MSDDAPGELTPPGPHADDPRQQDRPQGGLSVDEWLATQQRQGAAPGSPYGHPPLTSGPPPWRELDQTSLMAFALALTVVAAPVGILLGVRGLGRTADGVRSGRWAAVLGIVVGIAALLGVAVGAVGLHWFRDNVKSIARVEAGECVDVDESESAVTFTVESCDESHEAEVVVAGDWGAEEHALYGDLHLSAPAFCFRMADDHYRGAARTGRYEATLVIAEDDPREVSDGDAYACYFTRADGGSLSDPVAAPGEKTA